MRPIIPPMPKLPPNPTPEIRQQMYDEYRAELMRLNPGSYNIDGSVKSFWQTIKHLLTGV